ncbi:MAG: glycosyltransferase family 2 protein [Chthoniobacteraceae bacterium]
MKPAPSLTIGIPCYNEALTIGKVVSDFRRVFPEARILIIDNASTDDTGVIAKAGGADVIQEPRKGKGYAVQRLFMEADTDYLIMVDGDDTYPAEEAPKLIDAIQTQSGDTVVGRRVSKDQAAFVTTHTWGNNLLASFIETVFCAPVGDLFSGYRLFTRFFYRNIPILSSGFEVETELALQTIDKGFYQLDVDIDFRSRPEGSFSKLNTVKDGFRVLREILLVIKDYKPLLFFSVISLVLFALAMLAGFFPVRDYICYRYVYRLPLAVLATGLTLLSALSFMCAVVLDTLVRHSREQFFLRIRNFRH